MEANVEALKAEFGRIHRRFFLFQEKLGKVGISEDSRASFEASHESGENDVMIEGHSKAAGLWPVG